MSKILVIIRTSTVQQELESQRMEMEAYCRDLGYTSIVWKEGKGASARKLNKAYLDLLEDVKATITNDSDIEAVAVWHLNRLGRKEKKLIEMKMWFIDHNINLFVKNPSLTLFDQTGKLRQTDSMFFNMLAVSIEVDTEELIAKTHRGKVRNKELGKFNGGGWGTLFGYRVKEDGYIEPDADESRIVNMIFEMYASGGYSNSTLSAELNDRGIKQRGRKFLDVTIKRLLSTDEYVKGTTRFTPIITQELWDNAQAVKDTNRTSIAKNKRILMATKILKCRHCGSNYVAAATNYQCIRKMKAKRFDNPCTESETVSIEVMDGVLIHLAKLYHIDYLSQPDTKAINELEERRNIIKEKYNTASEETEKIKSSLDRLRNLYVDGDIDRQVYSKKADAIKARQDALRKARGAYLIEETNISFLINDMKHPSPEKFISIFNNVDDEDNRKKLQEIVRMHIREAHVERTTYDGRKCMLITVTPMKGIPSEFIYFYTLNTSEVYEKTKTGLVKLR